MTEIVGACLSQFHDDPDSFELLLAFADGREIGHTVSLTVAQRIASEFANEPPALTNTSGDDEAPVACDIDNAAKAVYYALADKTHTQTSLVMWANLSDAYKDHYRKVANAALKSASTAEPVAWTLVFSGIYGVNAETTFKTEAKATEYAKKCGNPKPKVVPLFARPQSAAVRDDILDLYRMAVETDVTMEGVHFMGVNRSALKRAWEADQAALHSTQEG